MAKNNKKKTPTREQIQRNYDRLLGSSYLKGTQSGSDDKLEGSIVLGHFVYDYKNETELFVPAKKS